MSEPIAPLPKSKKRRRFILSALGIGSALIVGWGVLPARQRLHTRIPWSRKDSAIILNGWVKIDQDGVVTVAMPRCEMGQGVYTALPMLVAEELDVALDQVRIEQAPLDKIYGNVAMFPDGLPFHVDDQGVLAQGAQWLAGKLARELGLQVTGASSSIKDAWGPMREAGATARAVLLARAAKQWGVAIEECQTRLGRVTHASGKQASYGELAQQDGSIQIPGPVALKKPENFTLIGQPRARRDSTLKVNGRAGFGVDARPQGLLYAAVKMSPTLGATVQSMDETKIKAMPGVRQVLNLSSVMVPLGEAAAVAVVARTWFEAKQALDALPVVWSDSPYAKLDSAAVFKELAQKLDSEAGFTYFKAGDNAALQTLVQAPNQLIKAQYQAPFLAHATMEPMNCTAQVANGRVALWVGTQVQGVAMATAAEMANVALDQVDITVSYLGGGFGRRLELDVIRQALAIALQTNGAPVQVIWSREQDMTHDTYRPAALARFQALLDAKGNILAYNNKSASGSVVHQVLKRGFGLPAIGPDKTMAEGEFDMAYEFPNQKIAHVIVSTPMPLGFWRSVGHSHNAFFKESFIDECAHASGQDPVQFRLKWLKKHPRHRAVLEAAVRAAGNAPAGRAHGVALHQSFGTIVAQVAQVSVLGTEIRVHKVFCAVDCGIAVNPNIIAQQMESGIVFGLSAALLGEITLKNGQVQQTNFHDYPVLRMDQVPQVETIIIKSAEHPEGIGEPAVPPIAPAVANAVFTLTGKRLRSLPLKLA
jgi:isoquinoline 1-oxidoreductase subunit beta